MRFLTIFALCSFVFFPTAVMAVDEFGARFGAETPPALADFEDPEAALANIAPAAGEEGPATGESEEIKAELETPAMEPQEQSE